MEETVYTISEITKIVKKNLEDNPLLNNVWIKGEISNLTYHSSGHIYLSLKDEDAVISSVFFKYANKSLSFRLEEGMSVLVFGNINVFEKRGTYQFIISLLRLEGIGEILRQIEELKSRLLAEGLFDISRKKKIPILPRRLGIVTSPTGAAFKDIIKVVTRRFPNIEIVLAPAKVQGEDASLSIAAAIEVLNDPELKIDVIIAGRGGGSFEDLLPFNKEIVIRAFYDSKIPIISAVGHQIDHPISDDASDYAAPTPSAAAEIAVPVKEELKEYINDLSIRLNNAVANRIKVFEMRLASIKGVRIYTNPLEIVHNRELTLADMQTRLISIMKDIISASRNRFLELTDLKIIIKNRLKEKTHKCDIALQNLDKLSPIGVLKRGYSITTNEKGNIIKSIKKLRSGDNLNLLLSDGSADCSVNSIKKEEFFGSKKEASD